MNTPLHLGSRLMRSLLFRIHRTRAVSRTGCMYRPPGWRNPVATATPPHRTPDRSGLLAGGLRPLTNSHLARLGFRITAMDRIASPFGCCTYCRYSVRYSPRVAIVAVVPAPTQLLRSQRRLFKTRPYPPEASPSRAPPRPSSLYRSPQNKPPQCSISSSRVPRRLFESLLECCDDDNDAVADCTSLVPFQHPKTLSPPNSPLLPFSPSRSVRPGPRPVFVRPQRVPSVCARVCSLSTPVAFTCTLATKDASRRFAPPRTSHPPTDQRSSRVLLDLVAAFAIPVCRWPCYSETGLAIPVDSSTGFCCSPLPATYHFQFYLNF